MVREVRFLGSVASVRGAKWRVGRGSVGAWLGREWRKVVVGGANSIEGGGEFKKWGDSKDGRESRKENGRQKSRAVEILLRRRKEKRGEAETRLV